MKFINYSKQTVYLTDIDLNVLYFENNDPQEISLDKVKKSKNFRQMVSLGLFSITEHNNSSFEKSLKKQEGQFKKEEISPIKENIKNQDKIPVKLRGHFYEAGGYAKVNRNLALGLHSHGFDVKIIPTTQAVIDLTTEELSTLSQLNREVSNNAIIIDSMIPSFGNATGGKYKILYTTVEADTIPKQFVDCLNMYNEIWVPSDYCKEVIGQYINRKIIVIPNSIDNFLYNENAIPYEFSPKLNPFVFVSVFGWSYRKGYDALLRSYLEEFSDKDPVSLLIISRYQGKTNRSDIIKDTINEYINKYSPQNTPHIARFSKVISEKEMPRIYKACNSFVLFSRGEGFCIPFAESSLCGLPVIATNHSGHTMFLKENNSILVDIDKKSNLPSGLMHVHYWDNQIFPELKSDDFILSCKKSMRYVFDNYEDCKKRNKILSNFISDNYNIKSISSMASKRLREIWSELK